MIRHSDEGFEAVFHWASRSDHWILGCRLATCLVLSRADKKARKESDGMNQVIECFVF